MRDGGVLSQLKGCVESNSVSFSPALIVLIMLWWLEGLPLTHQDSPCLCSVLHFTAEVLVFNKSLREEGNLQSCRHVFPRISCANRTSLSLSSSLSPVAVHSPSQLRTPCAVIEVHLLVFQQNLFL